MNSEANGKIICILGSTCTGKSQLALDIAQNIETETFEIINADAMQIFKGLDIATNKPTYDELQLVNHHMFSVVEPFPSENIAANYSPLLFTVNDYVKRVDELIREIHARNHVSIIVGGTNYYIKALFFKNYNFEKEYVKLNDCNSHHIAFEQKEENIFERLKSVWPEMAEKLHENDKRKIRNALNKYYSGALSSETATVNINRCEKLRYKNCIFLYLSYDNRLMLDERINNRVLKMIERGLLDELCSFHQQYKSQIQYLSDNHRSHLFEYGILQCIGYKEFHDYVVLVTGNEQIPNDRNKLNEILSKCINGLQGATRKYARKQESWYRNTWASHDSPLLAHAMLYKLDMGAREPHSVRNDAIQLTKAFLENELDHLQELVTKYRVPFSSEHSKKPLPWRKYYCEKCCCVCNGELEYQQHIKSRQHKKTRKQLRHKQDSFENS